MLKNLWNDEAGFIISAELVLVATIVVIGMIAGLTSVRDAVITELADVGAAIASLNQSYSIGGASAHCAFTSGSVYVDTTDFCDVDGTASNACAPRCLFICAPGNEIPHP